MLVDQREMGGLAKDLTKITSQLDGKLSSFSCSPFRKICYLLGKVQPDSGLSFPVKDSRRERWNGKRDE